MTHQVSWFDVYANRARVEFFNDADSAYAFARNLDFDSQARSVCVSFV